MKTFSLTILYILLIFNAGAQHIYFEHTDVQENQWGIIDIADVDTNFLLDNGYSNTPFKKDEGWELVAIDNGKFYYQITDVNSSEYGIISYYDKESDTITEYGYLSDIFSDPNNWTLTGVDSNILYFKTAEGNAQIVSYDGTTLQDVAFLSDIVSAPDFWDFRAVHNGEVFLQWIQNNTFTNSMRWWNIATGADTQGRVTDFYGDSNDANIVGVSSDSSFPENISFTSPYTGKNNARGENLRVMRLAVSTTGHTTEFYGGKEATIEQLNTWLAEVNDLYGRELCMRFVLVENNDDLIFEDGETDPWVDLDPGTACSPVTSTIFQQQKEVFDEYLGAENYDMSHVIVNLSGGGCASVGDLHKGASGRFTNSVRHELAHQLGQLHTLGTESAVTNYEQGGGWTIMGGNGNPYIHSSGYHISSDKLEGVFVDVGERIITNNTIPTINAGNNYTIPISTPFKLTAEGFDAESETLTYVWDSFNPWTPHSIPREDDIHGGLFKRFFPSEENYRFFPKIEDIIANNNVSEDEQLPTQPRTLDFRVTINDGNQMTYNGETIKASGINSDDVRLVVAEAGPFEVTSQAEDNLEYAVGELVEVNWNVNNTDIEPINATEVEILLSADGGYTYGITLDAGTENDGSAMIQIPGFLTTTARIQVKAVDNIFFDINTNNFSITERECTTTYYNGTALIEAEDYCEMKGIQKEILSAENENIGFVNDGDYIRFSNVDFLNESIQNISVYASSATQGGTIEIRTNTFDGELIGSVSINATGSWSNYEIFENTFPETIQGVNDLFLVFKGGSGSLFNLDYFTFANDSTLSNQNNLDSLQNILVTLSPNPAKDLVYLSDNEQTDFKKVEVYDLNGSNILSTDIFKLDNKYEIDIQGLATGMYFMLVHDSNNLSFHTKLIVKK